MKKSFFKKEGFTLIELLLVIGVIVALAITVFVALNPAKRLADARDARRTADVDAILTATHQFIMDNKGSLPTGVTTTEKMIGTAVSGCNVTTAGCNTASACVDLTATSTGLGNYLQSIPTDPKTGSAASSGYSIVVSTNGFVTVKACDAENIAQIWATR